MKKTEVQSLGWEDSLEEEMATHSSVLGSGKSHGQRSQMGCSPWGHKELDTTKQLNNNLMMLSNHGVGEDSLESLGLQGDQISQF